MKESEFFTPNGRDMDVSRDKVALELRRYRIRRGLTQEQLGKEWGVSRYTIIRAENSKNLTWESAYRIFARLTESMRKEGETV